MSAAFDKLALPIRKWIRLQGWRELRPIQEKTIRAVRDRENDLIVAASTAGGKTEAAFLPLVSQVLDAPEDAGGFDILYVGPLKALITDQAERLEDICRETELRVTPWHGDVARSVKTRALKAPSGILLITPEALEAMFILRGLEVPRLFRSTRVVVIDEIHSMIGSERGVQLHSLLARLEMAAGRPLRRIGLSATLGDLDIARSYLRPDAAADVEVIEADAGEAELRLQLRGYHGFKQNENESPSTGEIAGHIFRHLRGSDNLVFAGRRDSVEIYADRLRELCESERLPLEFHPHHANLSREHRDFVERSLKDAGKPTTAVCTSTLELGIDIGDVNSVAQVGAPFSVAALRQRLGRSGRRDGRPAILRQYVVEAGLAATSNFVDRLRLGLVRSIAMIDLLLEGWCEPPKPQAMHLSTLVHQILSVIAERGGASAGRLHRDLCRQGPFRQVDAGLFAKILRSLGTSRSDLIEQTEGGLLLLGAKGERLVSHYGFYAVFATPEEYRLVADGAELGTLPVDNILSPGMMLIFSGRRWLVQEIDESEKVIVVEAAKTGVPPIFRGDPGDIHDRVVERMFDIIEGDSKPIYMDAVSLEMLDEARKNYGFMGFREAPISSPGGRSSIVATRAGTVKTSTLALALAGHGFRVEAHDGFLHAVSGDESPSLTEALEMLSEGVESDLFAGAGNLATEKYHGFLTQELLQIDALSSRLDRAALPALAARMLKR